MQKLSIWIDNGIGLDIVVSAIKQFGVEAPITIFNGDADDDDTVWLSINGGSNYIYEPSLVEPWVQCADV